MTVDTVPTTNTTRAAAVAGVVAEQLDAMSRQLPEPALATPLGFFGAALTWAEHAIAYPAGAADEKVESLITAVEDGMPGAAELLGDLLAAPADTSGTATAQDTVAATPANDPDRVAEYLRRHFGEPDVEVIKVTAIGGGYSKYTILIEATVGGDAQELVLRQLPAGRPNDLPQEFGVISHVWRPGLPVPEPLWIEPDENALGGPFFATRRLPGVNLGDVMGASAEVPAGFCDDLADFLARLHATEIGALAATPVAPMRSHEEIREAVDDLAAKAARRSGTLSVRTRAVLAWLRANVPAGERPVVVVHGDVGLHNTLASEGRLSAVLDWERSHLGDAVEDLAYLRPSLEPHTSWEGFIERYVAAGGEAPDPAVERWYTVWQDTWRHLECVVLSEDFLDSRAVPMMIAGYVLGPKFLDSAFHTAYGVSA